MPLYACISYKDGLQKGVVALVFQFMDQVCNNQPIQRQGSKMRKICSVLFFKISMVGLECRVKDDTSSRFLRKVRIDNGNTFMHSFYLSPSNCFENREKCFFFSVLHLTYKNETLLAVPLKPFFHLLFGIQISHLHLFFKFPFRATKSFFLHKSSK